MDFVNTVPGFCKNHKFSGLKPGKHNKRGHDADYNAPVRHIDKFGLL